MVKPDNGKIQIGGKTYHTVAHRLAEFRNSCPIEQGWSIETECTSNADERIVFKAIIKNPDGRIVATGHAEEKRGSSQVNSSFALENAETSAIGRALKQAGFSGQEFKNAKVVEKEKQEKAEPKVNGKNISKVVEQGWESTLVPKMLLPSLERQKPIKWVELILDTAKIQGKNRVFSGAQYLHALENWESDVTSQPEIQGRIKAALKMREKVKMTSID